MMQKGEISAPHEGKTWKQSLKTTLQRMQLYWERENCAVGEEKRSKIGRRENGVGTDGKIIISLPY